MCEKKINHKGSPLANNSDHMQKELGIRFSYHPPPLQGNQVERYEFIRANARGFAVALVKSCPASDELNRAIDKLDEVVMLANAAIARRE